MTVLRELVQALWRLHNGHGDDVELVTSEHEWQFYEKLLVTPPTSVIEYVKLAPLKPMFVRGELGSPGSIDSNSGM